MTAQIIDGKALAQQLRGQITSQAQQLTQAGHQPGLAVILVGDNPASQVYVANKVKACEQTGIHSVLERYPQTITETELLQHIARLNAAADIDGILVQLPLPKHIDAHKVIEAISPQKDVDGFHVASAGALLTGLTGFRPCTPAGCMEMLKSIGYPIKGKHAVVIGRSNIVGKPMALMLLEKSATVTICHSATPDLSHFTKDADIIVAAVGKAKLITADMVKPGAVVIDVGMNRDETGKLCGDVDYDSVKEVAGWITPVPGGVGPMTITMLLVNTIESAQHRLKANQ
ncbi:Bifunctional protein FolD protein [Saezia sanguinis]|uniref:Bifunctional protein FolD n=1 Tax=Saezia sanguinis TaxID=1965230 RepID=A0A433SFV5_9BURK|nr:bifunctional methylenetetrahydrofolate dehydrogenase/methenyltetrahydrofolate cyclohydrolase FolD [Saezia sanguinis]RUS67623.1 Bifunctional protein FolD protein [Saezia sanguinis]